MICIPNVAHVHFSSTSFRHKQQMQDLVKQMETMQREYLLERQTLRAQLLAAVQSQEVVADLPLAALYSIPGTHLVIAFS